MNLHGTPLELNNKILSDHPDARDAYEVSLKIPAQLLPYQALALFALSKRFNFDGANILEIGTAAGFSASLIAQAAPMAKIVTLNPRDWEVKTANNNLNAFGNVTIIQSASWDFLANYSGPELDMVFVDGDHRRVVNDMPWFNRLKIGGLMLFHDYSEAACPVVFNTVNNFTSRLGRKLDVRIVDTNFIGIAGLYRKEGECYP